MYNHLSITSDLHDSCELINYVYVKNRSFMIKDPGTDF